jgi:hypothetical protein
MRRTLTQNTAHRLIDLMAKPDTPNAALAGAGAGNIDNGNHRWGVAFVGPYGLSLVSAMSEVVNVADKTVNGQVNVTNIPIGPPGTTARKVYRTVAAGGTLKLLTTINDNTTVLFLDNVADAGLGADAPAQGVSGAAGLPRPVPYYAELTVTADGGNGSPVYVDYQNSGISATSFGAKLDANQNTRYAGPPAIASGDVWVFSAGVAQRIQINGRDF